MNRSDINPWDWSQSLGYSQATQITGAQTQLICSGQCAMNAQGSPQHPDDMRAQLALSLENVSQILQQATMGFEHVTHIRLYTTDVDEAMQHFDLLAARFGPVEITPTMTVLGVSRLALPSLQVEVEITAAA